ncbi:hypothetical protein LTR95_013895 [Oleoguttula sp. CCFEE 5521]
MASPWTEAEKLGLFLQIIAKLGPIPWADIELPAGRTRKACDVMISKEKMKVKKDMAEKGENKEDDDEDGEKEKSASPKKRKAATDEYGGKAKRGKKAKKADEDGDCDREEATTPKLKKGRGKKAVAPKVEPQSDDDTGALEAAEETEAEGEGAED